MSVYHMGEVLHLPSLLAHYRLMARTDRKSSRFWRLRASVAIAEYREQRAMERKEAA